MGRSTWTSQPWSGFKADGPPWRRERLRATQSVKEGYTSLLNGGKGSEFLIE